MLVFWHIAGRLQGIATWSDVILREALPLVGRDPELIYAMAEDASYGLLVNYEANRYLPDIARVYELVLWGPAWLSSLADEPPSPVPFASYGLRHARQPRRAPAVSARGEQGSSSVAACSWSIRAGAGCPTPAACPALAQASASSSSRSRCHPDPGRSDAGQAGAP